MRTKAPMAAPATAINDPCRRLPSLLPVVFGGTAAPLVLCVPLLPAAEEIDGAAVVEGTEVLASDVIVPGTVVVPVELAAETVVEGAETEPPVDVAEDAKDGAVVAEVADTKTVVEVAEDAKDGAVAEVADTETVVEVAETDAIVAGAATKGVQQERYEVVRIAVPV